MARDDKSAVVDDLAKKFEDSTAAVLTEYRGLSVAQLQTLRRSLGRDTTYAVVKNTLTRRAAAKAGVEGFEDQLAGPSAIAFIDGDPVEAAKGLRAFAKDNPALVIKAGYMDGRLISAEEVGKLADLESREVLLSKMAGAMKASLSQAASLFQAPLAQTARTVEALRTKREAEAPETVAETAPAVDEATSEPAAEAATDSAAEASE